MKKIIYISSLLLTGLLSVNAQQARIKKADTQYDNYQYIDAIATFENVANRGYKTPQMMQSLGNAYYFNAQYIEAAKWYAELFELQPTPDNPEYYMRYSLTLKSIEEYDKANKYLEKYYQVRGEVMPQTKNYLEVIEENSGRFEVENAEIINSEFSDYGATLHNGELIFTSTRRAGKFLPRSHSWNNQPHSVLYAAQIDDNQNLEEPTLFSSNLDSKFDEATPVFTNDGTTVYFTRTNYLKKRGYNQDRITLLKIYQAKLIDDQWSEIKELPFNSDNYSVAHPALSADNQTLYFASDMPGGFGDADIWKVSIKEDGTFGEPINLGATVNTAGRESFPFVSSESELYYASTGKLGLGGMDVFMARITTEGNYEEAINVGKPINSPMDDFGFYINANRKGFFSSNREGGRGDDDIYKFTEHRELVCQQLITGIVTDINTKEPLAEVAVELYDESQNLIATTFSDQDGKYSFDKTITLCNKSYRIRAEKENYSIEEEFIKTPKEPGESQVVIGPRKVKEDFVIGQTLNEILDISIIHFDLNKWNIRPDAEIEIAKVLQIMEDYPKMKIEIGSHTDSRASHAYNEKLSERRAQSTRKWLIEKGISPNRITAKGYGETQLVNECVDGVICTEEQHQMNRRSIFIITSMGDESP